MTISQREIGRQLSPGSRIKCDSIVSDDFETAIRKAGCGKFNLFMMLLAIPAASSSGFVTATMSYVVPVASKDLGLTPTTKALLQSAPYAGMIISAIFWGVLSDSMGRQKLLAIGFLLDSAMNTCCALIPTLPTVLIFKFLSGVMVCGPYSIFMAYMSEVFEGKRRDAAVFSVGLFSHMGSILQACMALLIIPMEMPPWLPLKSWQLFVLCCGLPAFIAGIGCSLTVESPKFLIEKGKSQQALEVCQTIYTINTGKSMDNYPVTRIHKPNLPQTQKITMKKKIIGTLAILRPPYLLSLLMVFGVQFCIVAGMNMLRLWMPEMVTLMSSAEEAATNETLLCPLLDAGRRAQEAGGRIVSRNETYYYMMGISASCFFGHAFFMILVRFLNKKSILMGLSVGAGACALAIPNIPGKYLIIPAAGAIALLNTGFYSVIGIVVDIFPTSVRATALSLQMMLGRVGILSINFLFASLIYTHCEFVFYSMATTTICLLIICIFLSTTPISPPTKTKTTQPPDGFLFK